MSNGQRVLDFLASRAWAPTATIGAALDIKGVSGVLTSLLAEGRVHALPIISASGSTGATLWGLRPIPAMSVRDMLQADPDRLTTPGAELARRYGVTRQYVNALSLGARPEPKLRVPRVPREGPPEAATLTRKVLDALRDGPLTSTEIVARVWPRGATTKERQRHAKACCFTLKRQWRLARVAPMDEQRERGRMVRRWRLV